MGFIYQINVKPEIPGERGLPKKPVESALVTIGGIIGDFNRYRVEKRQHDSLQALLVYPLEMLVQLQEEGWPVQPGDLGENLTTSGIAYDSFVPGKQYKAGEVIFEIAKAAAPCKHLFVLSYTHQREQEFLHTLIHRRGWYACVITGGIITRGDSLTECL